MASFIYDLARKAFADGSIHLLTDTIKFGLAKAAYTPNQATHQYFSDLGANFLGNSGGNTYADGETIGNKTTTAGVFNSTDTTPNLDTVTTGQTCSYLIIYKVGTGASDSPLIACIDITLVTNGNNVNVTWDPTNKIFKL